MPTVPEALPPPKSLGGLLNFTEEVDEETTISGLIERANELSEDIQERRDIVEAIDSIDNESAELENLVEAQDVEEEN